MYLPVGELLSDVEIRAFIDECNVVAVSPIDVLVNSIVANVDLSVREPAIERRLALVEDLGVGLVPVDLGVVSERVEV